LSGIEHIPDLLDGVRHMEWHVSAVSRVISRGMKHNLDTLKGLGQALGLVKVTVMPYDISLVYMTRCATSAAQAMYLPTSLECSLCNMTTDETSSAEDKNARHLSSLL
jgi:hypothetical protein